MRRRLTNPRAVNERKAVRIFHFLDELDAFVVTEEYRELADYLHLAEWTPVVWIGRLFRLDNDVGEHWFDNWDLREERAAKAETLGIYEGELLIIDPDRFQDGRNGPCHDALQRKRFWTDVLRSLELSYETLFDEARKANARNKEYVPEEYLPDLEDRIERIGSGRFEATGTTSRVIPW
jgi:hypothetical protein